MTWQFINNTLGKNKAKLPESFLQGNDVIHDQVAIANIFNKHFVNIGQDLSDEIGNLQTPVCFSDFLTDHFENSLFFMPVTKCEICNIVKQFDSNKSAGYDNVNVSIIKSTINFIIEPIIHICNISLNTGVFPSSMKLAKVIPVFKKGDQNNCNNYRPISVLPIFSKIVERIVYNRLYSFLLKIIFFVVINMVFVQITPLSLLLLICMTTF